MRYLSRAALILLLVLTTIVSTPARTFASGTTFTNTNAIVIYDNGPSSRYPSYIQTTGLTDMVASVGVTLNGVSHEYPDDMRVLLVSPTKTKVVLMADAGGGNPVLPTAPVNLTFSGSAAAPMGDDVMPVTGTYKPSIFTSPVTFPSPAPAGPYSTSLSSFVGVVPNGYWALYVADGYENFTGMVASGWSLTITTSADADNDGILNATDNCPGVANVDQADTNGNSIGDACENVAPVLNPIADQSMSAGNSHTIDIVATDANSNLIAISTENLPSFASLTNTGNGMANLRFTPSTIQDGTYPGISITASDGELSHNVTFTLTVVTPNAPPALATINNQTISEGVIRNVTVTATDADPITLSATGLPAFVTFTDFGNGTGRLRLAPGTGSAGIYGGVTITAADAYGSSSRELTITVNGPNTVKVPTSGSGNPYPATITVSGMEQPITSITATLHNVTHSNPDDLDILLVGPEGQSILLMSDAGGTTAASNVMLTFDDSGAALQDSTALANGTYQPTNWAPAEGFPLPAPSSPSETTLAGFHGTNPNGVWSIFVRDDSSGDSGHIGGWSLDIEAGLPPTLAPIGDQTVTAGETTDITVSATDSPGETIALSATNLPAFATFVDHLDGTGTLSLSPGFAQLGTFGDITISASNASGTDSEAFSITTVDGTDPTTTSAWSTDPNDSGWHGANVTLTISAADSGSGVESISYTMTGAQTVATTVVASDTADVVFDTNGVTTITWFATDAAGNTQAQQTKTVRLDKLAPTIISGPTATIASSATAASTDVVPVRVTWAAADNPDGSGVQRYMVQLSSDNGTTWSIAAQPTAAVATLSLDFGTTYLVRVRAFDVAGKAGPFANSGPVVVRMRAEGGTGVTYTGSWTTTSTPDAYGGWARYGLVTPARVSYAVTTSSVGWVSATCPDCGRANVYIDGVFIRTFDLYSPTLVARRIVFSQSFDVAGAHTIEVRVVGTKNAASNGTAVPIDGFVYLQ